MTRNGCLQATGIPKLFVFEPLFAAELHVNPFDKGIGWTEEE